MVALLVIMTLPPALLDTMIGVAFADETGIATFFAPRPSEAVVDAAATVVECVREAGHRVLRRPVTVFAAIGEGVAAEAAVGVSEPADETTVERVLTFAAPLVVTAPIPPSGTTTAPLESAKPVAKVEPPAPVVMTGVGCELIDECAVTCGLAYMA